MLRGKKSKLTDSWIHIASELSHKGFNKIVNVPEEQLDMIILISNANPTKPLFRNNFAVLIQMLF